MSRLPEVESRVVQAGEETLTYGPEGWDVDRLSLLAVLTAHPGAADEMAEARVAYSTDAGKSYITSEDGWRVDRHRPSDQRPRIYSTPRRVDPRVAEHELGAVFAELGTSTKMTEMPWLQPVIDLERVTGTTHQDFVFVAGISELQEQGPEAERVAAFTDIVSVNPVGEFGAPYRLTRNIQLLEGINNPEGNFASVDYGPNIRHGADFGLTATPDDWVAWSWVRETPGKSRLYPVNSIASATEILPGGVDGLVIPTHIGRQALSAA